MTNYPQQHGKPLPHLLLEQCETIIEEELENLQKLLRAMKIIEQMKDHTDHYDEYNALCCEQWGRVETLAATAKTILNPNRKDTQ